MKTEQRTLDPILTGIIKNYNDAHGDALPPADNVGDFTNRIIQSKQKDKCYFLRMVVLRLNKVIFCTPAHSTRVSFVWEVTREMRWQEFDLLPE